MVSLSLLDFEGSELKAATRRFCQVGVTPLENFQSKELDVQIAALIVLFFGLLVGLATAVTQGLSPNTFLNHFCAWKNSIKLVTDYRDPHMKKVRFLDTFKTFYHFGGCYAHLVGFIPVLPMMYSVMQDVQNTEEKFWPLTEWARKAIYATQIAFFISGIFSCYYFYPIIVKAKGRIGFWGFVGKRFLRTLPTTMGAIVMLFAAGVFYHGPIMAEVTDRYYNNCRHGWFYTVFYINNFLPFTDICLPHSWYLSVDMQLWILSYFPLIWLYKNPRLGVISCIALIGLGVVIPAIVLYLHELPTVASGRLMDLTFLIIHGTEFPRMHFYSYNNMSSYFLGILVGYCFATDRKLPNFVSYLHSTTEIDEPFNVFRFFLVLSVRG